MNQTPDSAADTPTLPPHVREELDKWGVRSHQLAAKAALETVHAPQPVVPLLKPRLQRLLVLVRHAVQVIAAAAPLPGPPDRGPSRLRGLAPPGSHRRAEAGRGHRALPAGLRGRDGQGG